MIDLKVSDVNYSKLHAELIAANISVLELSNDADDSSYIAPNAWIKLSSETDMHIVQSILDAHDPTPLPQPISEIEQLANHVLDVDFRVVMLEMGM